MACVKLDYESFNVPRLTEWNIPPINADYELLKLHLVTFIEPVEFGLLDMYDSTPPFNRAELL